MFSMRAIIATLAAFLFCSCGYQFQGGGSVLPPDVKNIYVPNVENNTTEAILTQLLTEALRDRFERYGVVTVVEKRGAADAVLNARILSVKNETKTVTSGTDVVLQYIAVMTVAAELTRTSGGVLWRDVKLKASQSYGATSDVVVTSSADFSGSSLNAADLAQLGDLEVSRGQEQETFADLADTTARKVYEAAVTPRFLMLEDHFVITMDGLAGSGKTTLSRGLAQKLGLVHFSSGGLYRALAWIALNGGVCLEDGAAVAELLSRHGRCFVQTGS